MSNIDAPNRVNRRLSARIACRLTVSYRTAGEWHPATGMDVSTAGCRLRLGEDLPRGSALKVRLEHSGDGRPLFAELDGTVIWSRLEGLSYQVGIQFAGDTPALHEIISTLGG